MGLISPPPSAQAMHFTHLTQPEDRTKARTSGVSVAAGERHIHPGSRDTSTSDVADWQLLRARDVGGICAAHVAAPMWCFERVQLQHRSQPEMSPPGRPCAATGSHSRSSEFSDRVAFL